MTKADIIIIGGGAAGLMAAFGACSNTQDIGADDRKNARGAGRRSPRDRKVIVLEKMPRPGRKIMLTGKGRCNFTNVKEWKEFSAHIHPKPNFLKPAFYGLSPEKLIRIFEDYGMRSIVERGDRAFPVSHKAMDVVDTLSHIARSSGAEILCGKEVCEVSGLPGNTMEENGMQAGIFRLACTDGSTYTCDRLIITTGGLSYPTSGSTGDGYGWAKAFGHRIASCRPSLTAIVPEGYKTVASPSSGATPEGHIDRNAPLSELGRSLCGTSLKNVNIRLIVNGNTLQEEFGDLDFTDGGLEGPIGFKISRNCVSSIACGSRCTVSIDMKPAVEAKTLTARIEGLWQEISADKRSKGLSYKEKMHVLLGKVMPKETIPAFLHFNPTVDHKILADRLKNWKMPVAGYVGYERCVITAGGVSVEEVTAKTLESRLCPGLYFAGEILDLDADTGGYNLHIAFCTGYLAGLSATR